MAGFNDKILDMRINQNAYIKTILKMMIDQEPMLDELVLCKWITNALDSKNLPYSRKEIRTAIKPYYNLEFHGDYGSYMNFLSENCSNKVVHLSKLKNGAQASRKRAVAVTCGTKEGLISPILNESTKDTPKPSLYIKTANLSKNASGEGAENE